MAITSASKGPSCRVNIPLYRIFLCLWAAPLGSWSLLLLADFDPPSFFLSRLYLPSLWHRKGLEKVIACLMQLIFSLKIYLKQETDWKLLKSPGPPCRRGVRYYHLPLPPISSHFYSLHHETSPQVVAHHSPGQAGDAVPQDESSAMLWLLYFSEPAAPWEYSLQSCPWKVNQAELLVAGTCCKASPFV